MRTPYTVIQCLTFPLVCYKRGAYYGQFTSVNTTYSLTSIKCSYRGLKFRANRGRNADWETFQRFQEKMRRQRGRLPVQPLGYVMSTEVIFRRAEVSVLAEVYLPRRQYV